MESLEKLRELLASDIARFDIESTRHKRIHRRAQVVTIGLTAVTAIVAGTGLILPDADGIIQFTILCLAATTTAVTTWAEMRRARELWQHEREVFYALKDILRELDFLGAIRDLDTEEVATYFHRASSILGSSTQNWSRILERKTDQVKGT